MLNTSPVVLELTRISATRNQAVSRLLRTPAEVRNKIYILALDTATVRVTKPFESTSRHPVDVEYTRYGLTLPGVCRQIRHEAAPLLDGYTLLFLEGYCLPKYLAAPSMTRRYRFASVRELYISMIMGQSILISAMQGSRIPPNMFLSLERVVVRKQHLTEREVNLLRDSFRKPGLEVVCTGPMRKSDVGKETGKEH